VAKARIVDSGSLSSKVGNTHHEERMSGRRRANRHRVAAVLFVACGCHARFETISVNVADKVDEKMRDHIGDEIAPPDIEDG